jgi:2-oxoglutarate/2-oxoacid ferredoxin oxidoreductase subunit alpha
MTTGTSPAADAVRVNDFALQVATANGSGSQTANNVLLRSIFRMGIPVSGKNLFPSNIQGLPTWFTIRASRHGYIGRKRELDVLVLMNPETAAEDGLAAAPGTSVVYEKKLAVEKLRDDLRLFPVPFAELAAKLPLPPDQAKLRRLLVNMIYVGVLSDLMGIEPVEIEAALRKQLRGKAKAIDLNLSAMRLGADYAAETFPGKLPHRVERMNATAGKLIIDGNSASALGCLFGGATVCTWYPITPSSSLCETFIDLCAEHRVDEASGKATAAIVQAEDEIASIGMVLGAGWAGARAFTATSGPGISLMSELIGYGYYTEIPAVIFDVQRVGPSTGLPTRTMQGDVLICHTNSHGDGKHPVLFPSSPEECFTMAQEAFDVAERLQTPVFVLTDLDLGMNNWMADPFPYPERPFDRGKVLDAAGVERLKETWGRYRDLDGDGVPWRTLPATDHPKAAYFTRGSGHNEAAGYTEKPHDYVRNVERLARKLDERERDAAGAGHRGPPGRDPRPPRVRHLALRDDRGSRPARARPRPPARLPAPPGPARLGGGEGMDRPPRDRLRRRAEPRRPAHRAPARRDAGPRGPLRSRPPVRRPASRRHDGRRGGPLPRRERRRCPMSATLPTAPKTNRLGLAKADYEGGKSTLCLGCGHDVITKQIVTAFWEMGIEPRKVAKFSGIGCSSKTPAYFLNRAWGVNAVHGRMPAVATGAILANPELVGIGVSGDGDTGSIGIGPFVHLVRRNIPLVYVVENNGVYGLTKGQFSATADVGSTLKGGGVERPRPDRHLRPGHRARLRLRRPLLLRRQEAAPVDPEGRHRHRGTAVLDVISPCVTFNDHEGSTKSYKYAKDHEEPLHDIGFVPYFDDTIAEIPPGEVKDVPFPDGSLVRFHSVGRDYDPTDKDQVLATLHRSRREKEFLTGILYLEPEKPSFAKLLNTVDEPLTTLGENRLRPSPEALAAILEDYR